MLTQVDYDVIARETERETRAMMRELRYIDRHGKARTQWWDETLSTCGCIVLSAPTDRHPHNHMRLTRRGFAAMRGDDFNALPCDWE
jgi:hypothetical protein